MITAITNWIDCHRRRAGQVQYERGFQYAASALLQGVLPSTLEDEVAVAVAFGDHDHFDSGIEAAVREWRKRIRA